MHRWLMYLQTEKHVNIENNVLADQAKMKALSFITAVLLFMSSSAVAVTTPEASQKTV